ncbi:uncharacterized protein LOC125668053 isoform X2 [Ostrea edulis]|uniref:uncharacterized protein LOC125668053 isoform X2 n=1 Tax=Ostrea edulis TaxID=37623 RepID=UPI0024AF0C86|nr:uncharacterized protein LOC125668053 isoform X2 [Ostrea edulis]
MTPSTFLGNPFKNYSVTRSLHSQNHGRLMQNQDVFISFDSEIPAEDKIMVEIDGGMFEAKRINPYTYVFTFADCFGSGNRTVAVLMNEDLLLGTHQIVVKDGYQTLLDEINDVTSPLHYIQEILTTTQTNEGHLKSEMTNTLILEGTKNLIKKLHEKSDISGGMCSQMDQIPEKNTIMLEEGEEIVRRRSSRLTTRRRRSLLGKTYKRQSQRVSCAHEYLSVEENLPSIKLNSDLLKSLPPDFFDVAQ